MSTGSVPAALDDHVLETTSDLRGMWTILGFGRGVAVTMVCAIALIMASAVCVMVSARVLGGLVEALVRPQQGGTLFALTSLFLGLETLSVAAQYVGRVMLAKSTIEITYQLRRELFEKLGRLPISYFDTEPLGRTITRLTADVEGIETFFSGSLARMLTSIIHIVTVLVAMIATDLGFGLIIVAVSLPSLLFSVAFRKPVRFWMRIYRKRSAHLNARFAEYLNGIPVIKIFGLEKWTGHNFDRDAGDLLQAGLKTMTWNSFVRPATVFLCSVPTLLILWLGGERVLEGTMALGMLVAFVRYSERFISPIRTISQEIQNIQQALVASERVSKMLKEDEEEARIGKAGTVAKPILGDVEYRDVWMSYVRGQPVLKGINFKVRAGMKVGLVGATGSGKTTTVNLIPRLYPLERGRVLIDNVPLEDWDPSHVRSALGYVSQDVVVFSGTVRENLLAALPDDHALRADIVEAACAKTGLAQVLARFAAGLDHPIIEGGENLSMGERQLIAFTRMILRDPNILILDEATANIDERCEELIQQAIDQVMEGRTCFVIAHRLSTIVKCDLILVFNQGEIVEQGTHSELMERRGVYYELAAKQLVDVSPAPLHKLPIC